MVGYGPEDNHFVVELTYNYGLKSYKQGNDYQVHPVHIPLVSCVDLLALLFMGVVSVHLLINHCRVWPCTLLPVLLK